MFTDYEKVLQDQLSKLIGTIQPIVLFGAISLLGDIAQEVLLHFGKTAACYCDSKLERRKPQKEKCLNIPVLSVLEAYQRFPQAMVVVCAFDRKNRLAMAEQARRIGFLDIAQPMALLYAYQTILLSRSPAPGFSYQVAETIKLFEGYRDEEEGSGFVFDQVSELITDKCNLKCRYCCNHIPYIPSPSHYDAGLCNKTLDIFCESVDAIYFCTIIGGESLLHPQIVEICKETAKHGNILMLNIFTNASWLPKEEIISQISKFVTKISITDYGPEISIKKEELMKICEKYRLLYEVKPEHLSQWYDFGPLKERGRSREDNDAIYRECRKTSVCPVLYQGRFSSCASSLIGTHWDVPLPQEDYVDLLDNTLSQSERRSKIRQLMAKDHALAACDYCNGYSGKQVTPGEQI